jgi:Na+:H+ antiporter, NhaC family
VTSPLVPWNTCGAYMSGVLGVSTASYLPYCFFNLLSPVLDVVYGFLGFKVPTSTQPSGSAVRGVREGPLSDPAGAGPVT